MMRSLFTPHSLTSQMIVSFILIVVVTAVVAGLPGIIIIRNELDKRAWSRVDQGAENMKILYTARENELIALAKLIGHRACLQATVMADDRAGALSHLYDLISGTEIELVVLCDVNQQLIVSTIDLPVSDMCVNVMERGFVLIPGESTSQVWVTGSHFLGDHASSLGWVIAGIPANDALADTVHLQSGLEYTILQQNTPIFTSLEDHLDGSDTVFTSLTAFDTPEGVFHRKFEMDNQPYYAVNQPLQEAPAFRYEVALSVADIVNTQQQMLWLLIGGILVVIFLVSLVGILISRRISQPLEQLTDTAINFSSGNLSTPVVVRSDVREVVLVTKALEDARSKLLQTMTELNQEKAWTNHLLESIVEGIVTLDKHKKVTFFSHGAEKITGLSRDRVLGCSCDEVFKLPDAEDSFSQIIPSNGRESRVMVRLADQNLATLSFTRASLSQAEVDQAETALVFRDVSDEEVIHRRLGHFIANITHEFRTPLSALAASIELLLDQTPRIEPEDLENLLGSLHLGVFRLQTMIDNLIESASIEAGHFHVSPRLTELENIVNNTVGLMTPLFEKYGQHLTVQMPDALPQVVADPRRTEQVLVNLLSNANKYSPADANICVQVTSQNGYIRVSVTDNGPGIPVDQRDHLFHRYNRLGVGMNNPKAGAGLGLPVVKAIVEAQGGQIGVDNCPEGGSHFWFTMKAADEA